MLAEDDKNENLLNSSKNDVRQRSSSRASNDDPLPKRSKKKERSEVTYILKTINILVGFTYLGFALFFYINGNQEQEEAQHRGLFLRWLLPGYIGLSGLIIILIECRIGFMVRNLSFFYNYFGRGVFNIYAGGMPLMLVNDWDSTLDVNSIIAIVAAGVMCLIGVLYIFLKCCCCEKQGNRLDAENSE